MSVLLPDPKPGLNLYLPVLLGSYCIFRMLYGCITVVTIVCENTCLPCPFNVLPNQASRLKNTVSMLGKF